MNIQEELKEYLLSQGASDVGFARTEDNDCNLKNAVSIVELYLRIEAQSFLHPRITVRLSMR